MFFLAIILTISFKQAKLQINLTNCFSEGICEFYVSGIVEDNPIYFSKVSNGNYTFVKLDLKFASYIAGQIENILGITVFSKGDLYEILNKLKAKICKTEEIYSRKHYFAFSPYFDKFIFVNGKKTNLQIVIDNDDIVIGTPIIYGSY